MQVTAPMSLLARVFHSANSCRAFLKHFGGLGTMLPTRPKASSSWPQVSSSHPPAQNLPPTAARSHKVPRGPGAEQRADPSPLGGALACSIAPRPGGVPARTGVSSAPRVPGRSTQGATRKRTSCGLSAGSSSLGGFWYHNQTIMGKKGRLGTLPRLQALGGASPMLPGLDDVRVSIWRKASAGAC